MKRAEIAYRALTGVARTLETASRVIFHAAAGALPREALSRVITDEWDQFRSALPATLGLHAWEKPFFARGIKAGDRIFIVGCGSGRDLLPLLDQGHEVDGNDLVASCVDEAKRHVAARKKTATLLAAPIETCPIDRDYDVFLISWFTYQYIPTSQTRIGILSRLAKHLRPGGRILLSHAQYQAPPRPLTQRLTRAVARLVDNDWRPEAGDVVTATRGAFYHYEHYFQPGELESEASAAGLEITYHAVVDRGIVTCILSPSV